MASPTSTQFAVAVHVLTYLAELGDDRPVGATELAASTQVTPVHVRRVLAPLREAGLLGSTSGARGGWRLLRPAGQIRLDEVWRIVQDDAHVLASHGPSPRCPVGASIQRDLEALDARAADAVAESLAGTTVADLAARVGV